MSSDSTAAAVAPDYTELVADIVSAYVSNNSLPVAELPAFILSVHSAVSQMVGYHHVDPVVEAPRANPAVPIKKSVTDEFIICLEDGKKFKSLKRHLTTAYGMTPDEYRAKWGLPHDYPMVAPYYAAKRSQLAKDAGLGSNRAGAKIRGRSKKAA